jgi:hypothetical protein
MAFGISDLRGASKIGLVVSDERDRQMLNIHQLSTAWHDEGDRHFRFFN